MDPSTLPLPHGPGAREQRVLELWHAGLSAMEMLPYLPGLDLGDIQRILKALAREQTRALVYKDLTPIVKAQIQAAKGVAHFFLRGEDGKFERITNAEQIEAALNADDPNGYYISTKDPSTAAFIALMDRAIDKPSEHVEVTGSDGGPVEIIARIAAARKRIEG